MSSVNPTGNDIRLAKLIKRNTKHNHAKRGQITPEYACWGHMVQRCTDANCRDYKDYGGRGIRVCARWLVFESFLADMGTRPPGHSIDRFPDQNGNYEPGNVRWATSKEQARNSRRNRLLTFRGKTMCFSAWDEELGFRRGTVSQRINTCGWSIEKSLTTPLIP